MQEINKIYQKQKNSLLCKVEFEQNVDEALERKMDICFSKVDTFKSLEKTVHFLRTVL